MGKATPSLLPMETMGQPQIPAVKETRSEQRSCMEYYKIGTWPLASKPKSGIVICFACEIFCKAGIADAVHRNDLINRTDVVRDPYARWCGRRGVARLLPIPISCLSESESL